MALIKHNVNLKTYNTFGIEVFCAYFVELNSVDDFLSIINDPVYQDNEKLILGGGSNLLFTADFKGLVLKNNIKGIEVLSEDQDQVIIKAAAGENWHTFVQHCIAENYGGIENLSLIPGCVGASPMQNIGAYGVEIKEVFHSLDAYDMQSGKKRTFIKEECEFGYRESVFKNKFKNKYLITSVSFTLSKNPKINTSYGAINSELESMKVTGPGIKEVSEAVIKIRTSKLPDPKVIGNAGSFFKNPEVSKEKYFQLQKDFDGLVAYPLLNGNYKLAAGWMIEHCGLKGYEKDGAAVHDKQALVLVNNNNARGKDVLALSEHVIGKVNEKFGVRLEREVNII